MARPISRLLDTLSLTLTALREALTPTTPTATATVPGRKKVSRAAPRPSARPAASPKTRAKTTARPKAKTPSPRLALQGKYMAAIRGLSATNKAKVKKVLAAQGVGAAIALAQSKKA